MSKRTVKKEGWGISRWTDDIILSSIRNDRDTCIFDFARENTEQSLQRLWDMGFVCVKVRIVHVDE